MKKVKTNQLKIVIFTAVKNRCILHGRVFVMCLNRAVAAQTCTILKRKNFAIVLHPFFSSVWSMCKYFNDHILCSCTMSSCLP